MNNKTNKASDIVKEVKRKTSLFTYPCEMSDYLNKITGELEQEIKALELLRDKTKEYILAVNDNQSLKVVSKIYTELQQLLEIK